MLRRLGPYDMVEVHKINDKRRNINHIVMLRRLGPYDMVEVHKINDKRRNINQLV